MNVQFIEDDLFKDYIKSLGLSQETYWGENAKMIIVGKKMVDSAIIDMFKNPTMDFTILSEDGEQMKTISTTFSDT